MNRLTGILFLFLFAAGIVQGQETWEGNATVIRRGEFDSPGLFAASNSFPKNTRILVENSQTGKRVHVTVLKRIDGPGNLFLLLSEQAASTIGLSPSEVVGVKAQVTTSLGVEMAGLPGDLPYNPDPDINPAMGIPETEVMTEDALPVELEEIIVEESEGETEVEEEEVQEEILESTIEEEVQPTPEEQRLEDIASRIPQKHLFMLPREDERFELIEDEGIDEGIIAEIIAETTEIQEKEQAPVVSMVTPQGDETLMEDLYLPGPTLEEPEKPTLEGKSVTKPEEESLAYLQPNLPHFEATEEKAEAVSMEMALESESLVITLEPCEPKPPPEEDVTEEVEVFEEKIDLAEREIEKTPPVVVVEKLPEKSYFLQLGAYSTRLLAEKLAQNLQKTYTVAVLPVTAESRLFYRVLIGPLNRDESGTLLYNFQSLGFKDAFIKYVD